MQAHPLPQCILLFTMPSCLSILASTPGCNPLAKCLDRNSSSQKKENLVWLEEVEHGRERVDMVALHNRWEPPALEKDRFHADKGHFFPLELTLQVQCEKHFSSCSMAASTSCCLAQGNSFPSGTPLWSVQMVGFDLLESFR
jgi:hypothetical protein